VIAASVVLLRCGGAAEAERVTKDGEMASGLWSAMIMVLNNTPLLLQAFGDTRLANTLQNIKTAGIFMPSRQALYT
jgi:hypothetical protein